MAAAMNSGALLNAMPRMESDTFVRSRAAIYPATLVSLSSAMNSLNSAGRIFLTACGSTMSRIVALSNAALKGESPQDAKELSIGEAMDVMIRWFCILFGNQFTPDDVLDHYPVDRLMHDIALALMAVQTQTTSILDEFPTKAAKTEAQTATA